MPRRNRERRPAAATRPEIGSAVGWARMESAPDGDWVVRTVPGARGLKTYRCPGCDQEIAPGVGHIVAWPVEEDGAGPTARRHWHTPCWAARHRRRPGHRLPR